MSRLLTITFTTDELWLVAAYGSLEPPPTRRLRRAHLHLSYSTTPLRLHDTAPPRLLTEAAHGCLKPVPTNRLRRAYLHLQHSIALKRARS
jgi:hypothetical protein